MSISHHKSAGDPVHQKDVQRSLGFALIADHLRTCDRPKVLDLGPSVSANIGFLSQFRCKVYVEHFAELLDNFNVHTDDSDAHKATVQRFLQPYGDNRFDLILAWDIFNYLEFNALAALIRYLNTCCRENALLFALIAIGAEIRERPARFEIVDEQQLRYEVDPRAPRRYPRLSISDLLRRLPELAVQRTFLLKNGMQEYVFRLQSP